MTDHRSDPVRLRPPQHPVDPRAKAWWRTQLLLIVATPVVVLVVLGVLIEPARFWLLLPAAIIAAIGLPVAVLLPIWWLRVHRWEATETAVYTRTGHLWQEWRAAPMSRVQTVDVERGPLQQRFGLATVTVTTASSKGAIKIEGLEDAVAADLAERLTEVAESVPGDAT